jgi:hypothetical protein
VGVRSWRLPGRIRSIKQGALQNEPIKEVTGQRSLLSHGKERTVCFVRLKSTPRKAEEDGGRDDHIQMGIGNDFSGVNLSILHYFLNCIDFFCLLCQSKRRLTGSEVSFAGSISI